MHIPLTTTYTCAENRLDFLFFQLVKNGVICQHVFYAETAQNRARTDNGVNVTLVALGVNAVLWNGALKLILSFIQFFSKKYMHVICNLCESISIYK